MKKILITGQTRTGTSLIANFLNSQDGCVVHRDFLGIIFQGLNSFKIERFDSVLKEKERNGLLARLKAQFWSVGLANINSLTPADFRTLGELYDIALNSLKTKGCRVVGHKVTRQERILSNLLNETDISVIYTLRDLRDVILSAQVIFFGVELYQVCSDWKVGVNIAYELANSYPDRFYLLSFEDFVNEPAKECAKLSDFLGIDLRHDIKVFKDNRASRGIDWTDNSAFHDLDPGISSKASYRWKKQMSDAHIIWVNYVFRETLKQFGYEVFGLNLREKLIALLRHFTMSARYRLKYALIRVISAILG